MGAIVVENAILASTSFIIISLLGWSIKIIKNILEEHNSAHNLLQKANQKQIKASLLDKYRRAKANGGVISTHELDVFNDLYEVYEDLGGNGFMRNIKKRVNNFKVESDDI